MASKTQKLKRVRNRKDKPNPANAKADKKRIQRNIEILRKLESCSGQPGQSQS